MLKRCLQKLGAMRFVISQTVMYVHRHVKNLMAAQKHFSQDDSITKRTLN